MTDGTTMANSTRSQRNEATQSFTGCPYSNGSTGWFIMLTATPKHFRVPSRGWRADATTQSTRPRSLRSSAWMDASTFRWPRTHRTASSCHSAISAGASTWAGHISAKYWQSMCGAWRNRDGLPWRSSHTTTPRAIPAAVVPGSIMTPTLPAPTRSVSSDRSRRSSGAGTARCIPWSADLRPTKTPSSFTATTTRAWISPLSPLLITTPCPHYWHTCIRTCPSR